MFDSRMVSVGIFIMMLCFIAAACTNESREGTASSTPTPQSAESPNKNNSQNKSVASAPKPPEDLSKESISSDSGLTVSNVQRAVRLLMSEYTKGGSINVEGVKESPNENGATADLRFDDWLCSTTPEGRLSKEESSPATRDSQGLPTSLFGLSLVKYNTSGLAVLTHYNDGRWVLKEVRVGDEFSGITHKGTQEVK